ncbi:MAG TPA: hypothetical protein PKN04_11455 [bacterium]|nr:hypothetical protein [bacterium]
MAKILLLPILFLVVLSCHQQIVSSDRAVLTDPNMHNQALHLLFDLCDWAVDVQLATGELAIDNRLRTSVFINSNLARMLCAGYDLSGNARYRETALAWFDHLVDQQQLVLSSQGDTAGYWGDLSPEGNIYLGDTGTAAHGLARAIRYTEGQQRGRYLQTLRRFGTFIRWGSVDDPQGKNRGGSPGWILADGENRGAIGCGYYRGELSLSPYSISTSVAGAGFFSALACFTGDSSDWMVAENALRWLLAQQTEEGEIPYILHNSRLDEWPLDTMSYFADGLVAVYLRSGSDSLRCFIAQEIKPSISWLLKNQKRSGVWGKMRSEDQQRSQGAINLLTWYYHHIEQDKKVLRAIHNNLIFFRKPERAEKYGIGILPISTGFVGLAIAEMVEPGITYALNPPSSVPIAQKDKGQEEHPRPTSERTCNTQRGLLAGR